MSALFSMSETDTNNTNPSLRKKRKQWKHSQAIQDFNHIREDACFVERNLWAAVRKHSRCYYTYKPNSSIR